MKAKPILALLLTSLAFAVASATAAPPIISYAGHVKVNGNPFTGQGQFKFAFVNGTGQFSYWSNDGESSAGSAPQAHVTVAVAAGNYTVLLGDTSLNGMGAIPENVFQNHNDVHLRIWFSDGVNGFQLLAPDRRFASVPYVIGNNGAGTANMADSSGDANGTVKPVTLAGGFVRLVANGPANPSPTLVLLDGDTADVVAYVGEATGLLEYSFGEHSFVLPKTFDAFRQTLIGPGSVRLVAPTGGKTLANLRVYRAGGRDNLDLEGGAPAGSQPPDIVSIPKERTVVLGGATTLFVSASGDNLTYQWKKNGQNISGATSAALVFPEARPQDSGNYVVVVGNADGNVTSEVSQLIVDTLMKTVPTGVYQINADPSSAGHQVALSTYMIDMFEVRMSYWEEVYEWATKNGYAFTNPGLNTDPAGVPQSGDHPVHSISWYDAVKWANARSEKDGFTPCYYTDVNRTTVYRSGEFNLSNSKVDWTASGYRLPTEAEWEVAARGGLVANKYSWGNSPFPSKANYIDTRVGKSTAVGTFDPNGYGIHDVGGNLREWVWDREDTRTYEYEFKETFPDANGYYNTLVDGGNTTAWFVVHTHYGNQAKYSPINELDSPFDQLKADANQVKTNSGSDSTNWKVKKTITLDSNVSVVEVRNEIMNEGNHGSYPTYCKMKFYYADGTTTESVTRNRYNNSWAAMTYPNPSPEKLVNKVEVWLRQTYNHGNYEAYEKNTVVYGSDPGPDTRYVTLNIPQYKEQNATHFRVKVETDREGDDDVWFQLFDGDNNKTYANADFDQLLPVTAPINQPKKLRIYLKRATTGATLGGTALKAVYWTTNDPKSLWTGSNRVTKDGAYSDALRLLNFRSGSGPANLGGVKGFRLVRRP